VPELTLSPALSTFLIALVALLCAAGAVSLLRSSGRARAAWRRRPRTALALMAFATGLEPPGPARTLGQSLGRWLYLLLRAHYDGGLGEWVGREDAPATELHRLEVRALAQRVYDALPDTVWVRLPATGPPGGVGHRVPVPLKVLAGPVVFQDAAEVALHRGEEAGGGLVGLESVAVGWLAHGERRGITERSLRARALPPLPSPPGAAPADLAA
jgi:hypothetical protein